MSRPGVLAQVIVPPLCRRPPPAWYGGVSRCTSGWPAHDHAAGRASGGGDPGDPRAEPSQDLTSMGAGASARSPYGACARPARQRAARDLSELVAAITQCEGSCERLKPATLIALKFVMVTDRRHNPRRPSLDTRREDPAGRLQLVREPGVRLGSCPGGLRDAGHHQIEDDREDRSRLGLGRPPEARISGIGGSVRYPERGSMKPFLAGRQKSVSAYGPHLSPIR